MKKLDSRGITLIELLATLAIIGTVSALVIGIIVTSMNNFHAAEDSNNIRSHANHIIFSLTNVHQRSSEYTIDYINEHSFSITAVNNEGANTTTINTYYYPISLHVDNGSGPITLTEENSIHIDLTDEANKKLHVQLRLTSDSNGRNDEVTLNPVISRMTKAGGEE
ncbi:prepilin-type N-terminal cleavage/methylation domain-containing protein [Salirhabdus salicampi]|uniref:prepilin-type N-terminal cleavage/methylation domain-containing protein n=1 Tax=Salirhabdus salicampi TaxID=476102 RepID=UPI0020C4C3FD|nr:type II secretion system protein [Salirhabdus salicampi]MCP8617931.1 type II secretion system GspH family protein [Salirhabdus salicampi]